MKLLLFDIDGTLIQSRGAGKRALERALLHHYGVPEGLGRIRLDGKTDPEILREALQAANPTRRFEVLDPAFRQSYAGYLQQELECSHDFQVLPGVLPLLEQLHPDRSFHLGLATGNMQEGARLKLARAGLDSFFAFGGYGCDAADRTQVILTAIARGKQQLGIPQAEVVVIGDTLRDVEHGRRAGAKVIGVATGRYSSRELQEAQPDLVVDCLHPIEPVLEFLRAGNGSLPAT